MRVRAERLVVACLALVLGACAMPGDRPQVRPPARTAVPPRPAPVAVTDVPADPPRATPLPPQAPDRPYGSRGTVRTEAGVPVPGARLTAVWVLEPTADRPDVETLPARSTVTDAEGAYAFSGFPDGTLRVHCAWEEPGTGEPRALDLAPFDLWRSGTITNDVVLPSSGTTIPVRVRVVGRGGEPLPLHAVDVYRIPDVGQPGQVRFKESQSVTEPDGWCTVRTGGTGLRELVVRGPGDGDALVRRARLRPRADGRSTHISSVYVLGPEERRVIVRIEEPDQEVTVRIREHDMAALAGTLVGDDGLPLQDQEFRLEDSDPDAYFKPSTDDEGRFEILVPARDGSIELVGDGILPFSVPVSTEVGRQDVGTLVVHRVAGLRVIPVDIADGWFVPGVEVRIRVSDPAGGDIELRPAADGDMSHAAWTPVASGTALVLVDAPGFRSVEREVTLFPAPRPRHVLVRMEREE